MASLLRRRSRPSLTRFKRHLTDHALYSQEQFVAPRPEWLQALLDNVPVLIDWYDANCQLQWVNQRWEQTLGWKLEEVRGRDMITVLSVNPATIEMAKASITAATGQTVEYDTLTRDGRVLRLRWANIHLPDGSRLGIGEDVTEREHAAATLRASEERFRTLVDDAPIGIAIARNGVNLHVNQSYLHMFGYTSAEEVIGQPLLEQIAPQCRAQIATYAARRELGLGVPTSYETIGLRKDGSQFPYLVTVRTMQLPDGPASVAFVSDNTERKRAEADRIALERNMLEAQKLESLGLLAGGVAHDFNNLLTGVLGNAALLLQEYEIEPGAQANIRQIMTAAQQAADLTRQLLAYAGKGPKMLEPVELPHLIHGMYELLRASIGRGVALQLEIAPDLPLITADASQVRQVVMNLVINAAEAIGDKRGTIVLRAARKQIERAEQLDGVSLPPGQYVELTVADTGIGMDAATLARIFEPFYSTKFSGRGLGLASVQGIVRSHQGAITAASTPGVGTTFTVTWPVSDEVHVIAAPAPPATRTLPSSEVLVVDDEPAVRRVLGRMLERMGLKVITAHSGTMGVQQLCEASARIACVFLDLTMADMAVVDAVFQMRMYAPTVPIVIMSGYQANEILKRFPNGEVADVLSKPFSSEDVRRVLEPLLVASP